jgi:hypothetical protein
VKITGKPMQRTTNEPLPLREASYLDHGNDSYARRNRSSGEGDLLMRLLARQITKGLHS